MREIDDLCLHIRHAEEFAEAAIQRISESIQNLVRIGYLKDSLVLGNYIWHRPACDQAECDDLGLSINPHFGLYSATGLSSGTLLNFCSLVTHFAWKLKRGFTSSNLINAPCSRKQYCLLILTRCCSHCCIGIRCSPASLTAANILC
jgi:hypothetical protein